jgi:broad specificity phosphatase PhoE
VGRQQVDVLADALRARSIEPRQVVCGSARRQRDTAAPFAVAAADLTIDPRWNEYASADVLSTHSATTVRLERRPDDPAPPLSSRDFQVLLDQALHTWIVEGHRSPAGQTWPAFLGQVTGALDDVLATAHPRHTTLVFTSAGVIAALCVRLLGLPDEAFVPFNRVSVNTGITRIVRGRSGTTLVSFNDHGHLDGQDPSLLTYR